MGWTGISLSLPAGVTGLNDALGSALNVVKNALESIKTEAQALQAIVVPADDATVVAFNAALQAVIDAVNQLLDEVLDNAGIYVLTIPLPKKGIISISAGGNPDEPGSNQILAPIGNLLAQMPPEQIAVLRNSSIFEQAFNPATLYVGGNAYFLKTLAESLHDGGDEGRPRFARSDNWAYLLGIAGASDLPSVTTLAVYVDQLLGQGLHAETVASSRSVASVVPTGIRVSPTGRGLGAVVQWEPVFADRILDSYDGARVVATRFAVIRSEDFRVKTTYRVADLFAGDLVEGMTGQFGATVVHVEDYDGITSRWVDTNVQPGHTYFYQVAFATRIENGLPNEPNPQPIGFDKLSACQQFRLPEANNRNVQRPLSTAPDWVRTPSVAALFPPINQFLDKVQEMLRSLGRSSQTVTQRNNAYIAYLEREIARLTRQTQEFENYSRQISNILQAPSQGLFTTTGSGTGTTAAFLADVINKFNDPEDTNKPPFVNGDEYVTGFVLLAVGPDPTAVARALLAFQQFFGGPSQADPVVAGVNSVKTALAGIEQNLIDAIANPNAPAGPNNGFNSNMTPSTNGDSDCTT